MAIQNINTGYTPEFALGAAYAGENAANTRMTDQLELIKQYLANQHAQIQNPLDEQTTQQNLDINQYKTTPDYQNAMTDIQRGQAMSNMAAGQTAKGLQPFRQQTEQMQLEGQQGELRNQAQIQAIDDALANGDAKWGPTTQADALRLRQNLVNRFKETPKFAGQREITESNNDSREYIAELNRQLKEAQAREKAAQEKPLTMSQAEALARNRLAANPNDKEAADWLKAYEIFKQRTQPGMGQVTLNPTDNTLTTVGSNLGGSGGGNDLQAAIMAEIERRKQGK